MKTINDIISMIAQMYVDDKTKKFAAGNCVNCQSCFGRTNGCYSDMYVISLIYVSRGDY